jgi:GntR family transcriptional regulator, transcriptional repressor for pyruvate dehydrogenase complex
MVDITAIHRMSTSDEVFRVLHDRIVSGDLKPGDRLPPQNLLAEQLSVSRNTVREAIHKLKVMGLLAAKPGVGTSVQVSSPARYVGSLSTHLLLDSATVREFLEARLFMEKASIRLAVLRATKDGIKGLRAILDQQMVASQNGDVQEFNKLDAAFHLELARLGQNRVLVRFLETISDLLHEFIAEVNQLPSALQKALDYHREITALLATRDLPAAENKMVRHLKSVADIIQQNLGTELDVDALFEIELNGGKGAARKNDKRKE